LANDKLDGFPAAADDVSDRVVQDVEIVIKNKPRSRTAGRISVVAA